MHSVPPVSLTHSDSALVFLEIGYHERCLIFMLRGEYWQILMTDSREGGNLRNRKAPVLKALLIVGHANNGRSINYFILCGALVN